MMDYELEKLTRRVMLDAARLEYSSLPEEPHPFSPAFERKMKKLLRRGRHPVLYRALRGAACFLLVLLLSGCAVLAVSPEAREAFAGWVREVYETSFIYRFSGVERTTAEDGFTTYRPTYIPPGFQLSDGLMDQSLRLDGITGAAFSLWYGMQTGIVLSGKSKDICSRR